MRKRSDCCPSVTKKEKKKRKFSDHIATSHTQVSCFLHLTSSHLPQCTSSLPSFLRKSCRRKLQQSFIAHVWIHKSPCVCHDHSPTLYCFLFSFSFRRDRSEDKGSGDQDQTLSCFPQAGIHLFSKKDKTQRRPNSMSTNPPLTNLTQSLPFPLHSYDYRIKKEASQMKEMFLGISVTDLP